MRLTRQRFTYGFLSLMLGGFSWNMPFWSRTRIPSLLHATITDLSSLLDAGKLSSAELTQAYIDRIADVNDYYHAVIEVNPDALAIARELDDEQQAKGRRRGHLHGLPILIKDNMATTDKMQTAAGSFCLVGAKPSAEARLVQKLREAGAVILGKTNLSEWANFRTQVGISGWSPRGGLTMDAYCENMKCSGSSSDAAVATTLGLAAATVGSETDGSIISPASRNNVIGFKPTVGLISNDNMIPLATAQDSPGPITRTVRDAAHLLNALSEKADLKIDYLDSCMSSDLSGLRIGVPSASFPKSDAFVLSAFEDGLVKLETAGAAIVRDADFSGLTEFDKLSSKDKLLFLAGSFKRDIEKYLRSLESNPHNLTTVSEIKEATRMIAEETFPERGVEHFELAESIDFDSSEFKTAMMLNKYFANEGGIMGTLEKFNLDVIATPAMLGPAVSFAARGGLPVVSVPLAFYPAGTEVKLYNNGPYKTVDIAPGVPVAITFLGKAFSERTLLRVAFAFEELTQVKDNGLQYKVPEPELTGYTASSKV